MSSFWGSAWSLPFRLLGFIGWFLWQFVLTSVQVVALILMPGKQPKPAIVRMSIDELTDAQLTILISLITITPDTLVIAVNRDNREMFVHGMFVAEDAEGFKASLRQTHDRLVFATRAKPNVNPRNGAGA